jgi:predicted O-linked N-acetylglucosamine transferase (SPINDLY family)
LRAAAHCWRDISGQTDDEVAALVRSDAVDILVDLNGHTQGNRLLVFARRPAPLQVTWLGYFNTTGLDAMDYLIADEYSVPIGSAQQFSEKVMRMPHSRFCYAGPPEAPEIAKLPALDKGYATFGSFNHLAKLNDGVIATWSRILQAVPCSRLVLKRKQFADKITRQRFMDAFARNGIDAERIELRQGSSHLQMLEEYSDIDIALDPFPYTGGMTTLEALWMGIPVVTLTGESLLTRQSASFLRLIGLQQLVAQDEPAYCLIARQLAEDPAQLAAMRAGLRARMLASPLCDCGSFVRDLEQVYHQVWRRFCNQRVTG